MAARSKRVCVPCRKVYGGGGSSNRSGTRDSRGTKVATKAPLRCTHCGVEMTSVNYRWRAPKRNDDRGWRRVAEGNWLWERDVKYDVPPRWRAVAGGRVRSKRRGKLLPLI